MRALQKIAFLFFIGLLLSMKSNAQRQMETLSRGVVALRNPENKVFVSWRLLGTEPQDIGFNLYRSLNNGKAEKLNQQPLLKGTNFTDDLTDTLATRTY